MDTPIEMFPGWFLFYFCVQGVLPAGGQKRVLLLVTPNLVNNGEDYCHTEGLAN